MLLKQRLWELETQGGGGEWRRQIVRRQKLQPLISLRHTSQIALTRLIGKLGGLDNIDQYQK
jgi:hypothetical protein